MRNVDGKTSVNSESSSGDAFADTCPATTWVDSEVSKGAFKDSRLEHRFRTLLEQLGNNTGESIPLACQDWANTKAAYRFLSNENVTEADILAGHFQATQSRFAAAADDPILVLHDTTEFSYQRKQPALVGSTKSINSGRDKAGRIRAHTICGFLMHASMAVTTEGLPLGLSAVKFWTRKKFKGTRALKRKVNPTRVPIEQKESVRWLENMSQSTELLGDPARCVHIGDRESDIYELFCTAREAGTHFLVRTCVNRRAGDGGYTIAEAMDDVAILGQHRIEVRTDKGEASEACLDIKVSRLHIQPPIGKHKRYPALDLTVIHALERSQPEGRSKIAWKLITDLPVHSCGAAIEKLNWYATRWNIEVFFKVLKSGCKAEDSKLRTAQRLANLISVLCIVSWRIFWMTMLNRTMPNAPPNTALTDTEIHLLDQLVKVSRTDQLAPKTLSHYLLAIAKLGGYLARTNDPPPGNMVMWQGLSRLTDIQIGATLGAKLVGN
jgi:hypothetical protein